MCKHQSIPFESSQWYWSKPEYTSSMCNHLLLRGLPLFFTGLGNHNYCRNPDEDQKPWCYYGNATHPLIGWKYCAINECEQNAPQAPPPARTDAPPPPPPAPTTRSPNPIGKSKLCHKNSRWWQIQKFFIVSQTALWSASGNHAIWDMVYDVKGLRNIGRMTHHHYTMPKNKQKQNKQTTTTTANNHSIDFVKFYTIYIMIIIIVFPY